MKNVIYIYIGYIPILFSQIKVNPKPHQPYIDNTLYLVIL